MQIQIKLASESWLLQKPTDLDLHCLQKGISGFSWTRFIIFTIQSIIFTIQFPDRATVSEILVQNLGQVWFGELRFRVSPRDLKPRVPVPSRS